MVFQHHCGKYICKIVYYFYYKIVADIFTNIYDEKYKTYKNNGTL